LYEIVGIALTKHLFGTPSGGLFWELWTTSVVVSIIKTGLWIVASASIQPGKARGQTTTLIGRKCKCGNAFS
jgi:hypothetical protein